MSLENGPGRSGTGSLRVLHVNDVAGVASAAVDRARIDGLDWRLWPLPPVRGSATAVKIWRRGRDLARFRAAGRSADVLHVHYGLFGYYAWSVRRPYLLHLHGTDVRVALRSRTLGPLVSAAIRRAGAVVYSTPELADAVRELRPDATWLPAPLSPEIERPPTRIGGLLRAAEAPQIVFASRWDPVKGLNRQLDLVRRIRARYPHAELVGIDWGAGARQAALAGVALLPLQPAGEFRALLAGADVVVGQLAGGALGVADLEAMALARPLIVRFAQAAAYGSAAPVWNTDEMDPMVALAGILSDPTDSTGRCAEARSWALSHHGASVFVHRAMPLYASLLTR